MSSLSFQNLDNLKNGIETLYNRLVQDGILMSNNNSTQQLLTIDMLDNGKELKVYLTQDDRDVWFHCRLFPAMRIGGTIKILAQYGSIDIPKNDDSEEAQVVNTLLMGKVNEDDVSKYMLERTDVGKTLFNVAFRELDVIKDEFEAYDDYSFQKEYRPHEIQHILNDLEIYMTYKWYALSSYYAMKDHYLKYPNDRENTRAYILYIAGQVNNTITMDSDKAETYLTHIDDEIARRDNAAGEILERTKKEEENAEDYDSLFDVHTVEDGDVATVGADENDDDDTGISEEDMEDYYA